MSIFTVELIKPFKQRRITYMAELVEQNETFICVRAPFHLPRWEHRLLTIDTGDMLYQYFSVHWWFNAFAVFAPAGAFKGWYCNIARPAEIGPDLIRSEDLEIDIITSADRHQFSIDDEDEYIQRGLAQTEPETHAMVYRTLDQVQQAILIGDVPFDLDIEGVQYAQSARSAL